MTAVLLWIGRVFCVRCAKVTPVVRQADVVEVRCPDCGELVQLDATGDEA